MNKKILIICLIVIAILAAAGGGIFYYLSSQQNVQSANQNGATDNFGQNGFRNNIKSVSGKVLAITEKNLIVDAGTAQSDVVWDATTQIIGNIASTQAEVLKPGNTVSINFTAAANGARTATTITKIDLTAANGEFGIMPSGGFPNGGGNPNTNPNTNPNGATRRGNPQGGQAGQNGNGPVRNNINRTSYTGTINAVNGSTVSITVTNTFNRAPSGSPTPTPETLDFNIDSAIYKISETKKITDIVKGDTLQIIGTLQANQQVLARRITIE
jgi:hypothetical protein